MSLATIPPAVTVASFSIKTRFLGGNIARNMSTKKPDQRKLAKTTSRVSSRDSLQRDYEADAKISVWWDLGQCDVPTGVEPYRISYNIVSSLRSWGFKGPVSMVAYADVYQVPKVVNEALISTGITLNHVPSGGKGLCERALMMDLVLWTQENPPPAHLLLISGDDDFSSTMHLLRMKNYNILLACPSVSLVSRALASAATCVWQWNKLARGEAIMVENGISGEL